MEDNTLWGGKCILFDNGPRLRVEDNAAIENADRITIEAWVNTLSWPGRAVVCRKEGSYIFYNYSGGFSWYLFGPDNRLQHDIAGTLGNGSWGYIVGTYDKDAGTNNQRLYLNGTRVAQTTGTQPIDLNSAALGIGRHVSGVADPFNGHNRRDQRFAVGAVGLDRLRPCVGGERSGRVLRPCIGESERGAAGGEAADDSLADAPAAAKHQNVFTCEISHDQFLVILPARRRIY